MGRIVANVRVGNLLEPGRKIECDALVDTGAAVDMLGLRLVHAKKTDLKQARGTLAYVEGVRR